MGVAISTHRTALGLETNGRTKLEDHCLDGREI